MNFEFRCPAFSILNSRANDLAEGNILLLYGRTDVVSSCKYIYKDFMNICSVKSH